MTETYKYQIMSIKERRKRDRELLQNSILEAANGLFLEVGYEKTTMRKIAERIEYNPATIYFYFRNKEEIFYALQKKAFSAFYRAFNEIRGERKDPSERLTAMGRAYISFALANPAYYDLMFIMRQPMNALQGEESWKIGERNFDLLRETVGECMAKQLLPPGDIDALAMMIWSAVHGLVSLYIRDRMTKFDGRDKEALIHQAFGHFDRMLQNVLQNQNLQ